MRWAPIEGYEGKYEVSDTGLVKALDYWRPYKGQKPRFYKGKILSPGVDGAGYYSVSLSRDHVQRTYHVHVLVAKAFVDVPTSDKKLCVNHKDGNKLNNYYGNLEWVTHSENNSHAYRAGLRVGPLRKFSDEDIRLIRASDLSSAELARRYGVDVKTLWNARFGKTYKEVI